MITFKDKLSIVGEFEAWEVWPDGRRNLVYTDANQIQYAGANKLATALTTSSEMSKIIGIITTGAPVETAPMGKPILRSDPVSFLDDGTYQSAVGFTATPSASLLEQQVVISRGAFSGYSTVGKYYEFALVLGTAIGYTPTAALAYKYVDGGLSWGVGANLEIVWTLFFGIS
jgi:hypothetical protein